MIKFDMHVHYDFFPDEIAIMKYYSENNIYSIYATLSPKVFLDYKKRKIENDYIKLALGAHPCYIDDFEFNETQFNLALNKTKYVSEVGLDFSGKFLESKAKQIRVFNYICSKSRDKLLVIHSRKAEEEVHDILKVNRNKYIVLHWYSGSLDNLTKFVNLGTYFSINSKMLKTNKMKKYLENIPLEKLLIETDAPFTVRDEDNFDFVKVYNEIVEYLSKYYSKEIDEIEKILSNNFYNLIVAVNNSGNLG